MGVVIRLLSLSAQVLTTVSRGENDDSHQMDDRALAAYEGKVAAMMSASPGRLGGLRGLVHLRSILSNIGVLVIPDQVAVGEAHTTFDAGGVLIDEGRRASIQGLGQSVAKLLRWNRCPEPLASRISSADCKPFEKAS